VIDRRRFVCSASALGLAAALTGCNTSAAPVLRLGKHVWPGYALLSLGADLGALDESLVKIVNTPSASASIRSLEGGVLDAACLTIDEVLTARESGLPLTVVAVVDVSLGADVLLAPGDVTHVASLNGLRIGVEQTAVGAVMLDAALRAASLTATDVTVVYSAINEHEDFLKAGKIDAVVTYEPVKSRLLGTGMREVFSSAAIPGKIIDTIAARADFAKDNPANVTALVKGFFVGRDAWVGSPASHSDRLGQILGLPATAVAASFDGLLLPDLAENRRWFAGAPSRIEGVVKDISEVLLMAGLLRRPADLQGIADGRFMG